MEDEYMALIYSHNAYDGGHTTFSRWKRVLVQTAEEAALPEGELSLLCSILWFLDAEYGEISSKKAASLGECLRAILPSLPGERFYEWRGITRTFISGCQRAGNNNESLRWQSVYPSSWMRESL